MRMGKRTGCVCWRGISEGGFGTVLRDRLTDKENKMEELLSVLSEIRPDVDFETETKLIDNSILDSFDIISIVGELNNTFDVEINVEYLLPENFNSAKAMYELICRLQEE